MALWDVGLDSAMGLDIGGLPMAGTIYPRDRSDYWAKRRNDRIYLMTIVLAHFFCRRRVTIADVGCHVSPLVLMMPEFSKRFAIDPSREAREAWAGVDGATFLNSMLDDVDVRELTGEDKFDLVMCHQVIEHIPDAAAFAASLRAKARRVILSTTFETPAGMMPGHVQDPISLEKLESWLPSPAICTLISRGPVGGKVLTVF
jgi:2-polyprenyl-3-methyl-5-hydroxy-6-metoxy-1,4-benzoquinol methylase